MSTSETDSANEANGINTLDQNATNSQKSLHLIKDDNIDGGYAWVILAAAACLFCTFGAIIKGFGVFFNGFVDEFGAQSSVTAVIPGVLQGTYSILSLPTMTIGLRYFSTRQFCTITGLLASLAFISGSFAGSVGILIITNGVMIGIAFGFTHGPLTYLNGLYFVKRRNLAQAIVVAGFSFGGLIFPPIYSYLIKEYGLRGGMLITGGIQLHIIVFALLLRPKVSKTYPAGPREKDSEDQLNDRKENIVLQFRAKGDTKVLQKPLLRKERDRSYSESQHNQSDKRNDLYDMQKTFISDQNLECQKHSGSLTGFLDKISSSNITRLLGESDMASISLTELRTDLCSSQDSFESEASINCTEKLKFLVDLSLFKNWFMPVYLIVFFFGSIGSAYIIIFIAPFAKDQGVSEENVASLVSLVNASDFLGRLLNGIITDRNIVKNHQAIIITMAATGICLAISPFYTEYWHFILLAITAGLCAGGIFAMTPSVVADFLGIENFRSAMGILILGQGLSLGTSAPLIGYLRDVTGTYVTSFYFMAACEFIAVIIFVTGLLIKQKSLK